MRTRAWRGVQAAVGTARQGDLVTAACSFATVPPEEHSSAGTHSSVQPQRSCVGCSLGSLGIHC